MEKENKVQMNISDISDIFGSFDFKQEGRKDKIDRDRLRLKDQKKRSRISRYCKEIDKIFNAERADKSSPLYDLLNTEPYSIWALDIMYSTASMTKICELFNTNYNGAIPLSYNGTDLLFQDWSSKKIAGMPKHIKRLIELLGTIYCEIEFFDRYFNLNEMLFHIRSMHSSILSDFNDWDEQLYRSLYDYLYYSESKDGDRFIDWLEKIHNIIIVNSCKESYLDLHRSVSLYMKDLIDNLETLTYSDRQTSMGIFEKIREACGIADIRIDKMEASND